MLEHLNGLDCFAANAWQLIVTFDHVHLLRERLLYMYDLDFEQQISIIIKSLGKIDERLERIEKIQEEHGKLLSHLVISQEAK